tara:strand:- start:66 stop:608 length:543 start_codon:yes stop_codon:yes gene_type:complete
LGSFTNFFQKNYDVFEVILTEFMNKNCFGSEDNPLDERAFYQSIFYWLMKRIKDSKEEGKLLRVANIQMILFFMDKANPDNFSNFQEDIFLEFLIELKKRILEPAKLIELIDITASSFPNLLKIGDSDEDTYKTSKEFKEDINLAEIMAIIDVSWYDSSNSITMQRIRKFRDEIMQSSKN